MKLLSAHLTAFGKFQNADFTFESLSCFCENNGYGKSTLVAFLLAMLYGMGTARKTAKGFPARRRYLPFGGGDYGGTLSLSHQGKTYVIERSFDPKSEAADTLKVYEDKKLVDMPNPGLTLLGLDEESFRRTLLLDSEDLTVSSTGTIASKLHGDIDDTSDLVSFDAAETKLSDAAKEYRKQRGTGGVLDATKTRLNEIEIAVKNLLTVESSLPPRYLRRDELRKAIALDEAKKEAVLARSGLEENRKTLYGYEEEYRLAKKVYEEELALHPKGIPSKEEVASLNGLSDALPVLSSAKKAKAVGPDEKTKLDELEKRFGKGLPSEEEVSHIAKEVSMYRFLSENSVSPEINEEEERLLARFEHREPKEEDIASYEAELNRYKELGKEIALLPKTVQVSETRESMVSSSRPKGLTYGAFGLGAVLLGAGIALCFVQLIVGIVLCILGVAIVGLGVFLTLSKVSSLTKTEVLVEKENPELLKLEKERKELSANIEVFLAPYGYRREEGVEANYALFKAHYASYLSLKEKRLAATKKADEDKTTKEETKKHLSSFFEGYGYLGEDYGPLLDALKADVLVLSNLRNKKLEAEKAEKAYLEGKKRYEEKAHELRVRYEWHFETAAEIEEYRLKLLGLFKDLSDKEKRLLSFKENHPDLSLQEEVENEESAEEISSRLEENRAELEPLLHSILEDEMHLEGLEALRQEKEELLERLEKAEKEYRILKAASDYLKEAREALDTKYLAPILSSFHRFGSPLGEVLGARIDIDREFNVTFTEGGKKRHEGHLSSGERTLVLTCLRLALAENMFQGETPFLILDDPFVHLDDEHMEKLRLALPKLIEKWQVLYFTCRKDRKI